MKIRNILIFSLTLLSCFILLTQCIKNDNFQKEEIKNAEADQDENIQKYQIITENKIYLLLLVASNSCECTVERGKEAEVLLKEIETENNIEIKTDVFDFAIEEEKVEYLADYYEVGFLPALLLFSKDGVLSNKLEFDINKKDIMEVLKILNEKG